MTQQELTTIVGITGMLAGFSGAYPAEMKNKCGELLVASNELPAIAADPLYAQNGILTPAGEDRVKEFADDLKKTIDSRRDALVAEKEKHRLELSMLDHASFVLENMIAGNAYVYDISQVPEADKGYYQLENRLVTVKSAEQLEQVEAMQEDYPLYQVAETSLASLKNYKKSREALDEFREAMIRESGMENAGGEEQDVSFQADGNNIIIENEEEMAQAPETSDHIRERVAELREEENRIDTEAFRIYQNIYHLTNGDNLDSMFMNAEELHGNEGFGGRTRGILNVVDALDEKLFPEDIKAQQEEKRDRVYPDYMRLSSRTRTYEKEQEKKRAKEEAAQAQKDQPAGVEKKEDAKKTDDLTYDQEIMRRRRLEKTKAVNARRASDAEAKERVQRIGHPEYVTGVRELKEQQLQAKLDTEKEHSELQLRKLTEKLTKEQERKIARGTNLGQLGRSITQHDPRKPIPVVFLESSIDSCRRKLVLRSSLMKSVEEDRQAAAKAYRELPKTLPGTAPLFLKEKKDAARAIAERLSRIRQGYTGDSGEYTRMKNAMEAVISLDENCSTEQADEAFDTLRREAQNYLREKRGFMRYRALFHKQAGKECIAEAENLVSLCDGAAHEYRQRKNTDAFNNADYQEFRESLKKFAGTKIVPQVPSLERTLIRKPATVREILDNYEGLAQSGRELVCNDPEIRSVIQRFNDDRHTQVYQDSLNAGLEDADRLGNSAAAMRDDINNLAYSERTDLYNEQGKRVGSIGNRDLGRIRNRLAAKAAIMDDPQVPVMENGAETMKTQKVDVRSVGDLQRQFEQHYDENVERANSFRSAQQNGKQFSQPLKRDMRKEGSREDIEQQMNDVRQEQMNDAHKSKEGGELSNRPILP